MIEMYEMMSTLRAVRRLRPDPIDDEVIERVLQAAAWAPTGGNQQPWHVVVVKDPAVKAGLQEIYEPEWDHYIGAVRSRMSSMDPGEAEKLERTAKAGDILAQNLAQAPALLLFFADFRRMAVTDSGLDRISLVGGGSVYPPVQNAMLACRAEGLGCTLTTLHCKREPEVNALLGVPDPWATAAMIPIGWPVGRGHGPITRRPVTDLASLDTWNTPWPA